MPQAVAAWVASEFSGAAITSFATAAEVSVSTAAVYAAAYVGTSLAIAYGSSTLQASMMKKGTTSMIADQGRNVMSRDPVAPRRKIYGQVLLTGPMYPVGVGGTKNEHFYFIVLLASHKCAELGDIYLGDDLVPLDGSGNAIGKYASNVIIKKHDGDRDQVADAMLVSELSGIWTSAHRGRGVAHLVVRLTYNTELFNGLPTVKCMTKGALIYDPRDGAQDPSDETTWKFSANAALCAADFLHDSKVGRGVPFTRINMPALIEAANICDESIVVVN